MSEQYKKVYDPWIEGNPAPIVNPTNQRMRCLGNCGGWVDSADGLCLDCWMFRHDARVNAAGEFVGTPNQQGE